MTLDNLDAVGRQNLIESALPPDRLARELFFHTIVNSNDLYFANLSQGKPLFGLRGRALVERGIPYQQAGIHFAYRIPVELQNDLVQPPNESPYEISVWWGSKQMLSLKKGFPPEYHEDATKWLSAISPSRTFSFATHRPELSDVVYLDPRYLIGVFRTTEAEEIPNSHLRNRGCTLYIPKNIEDLPSPAIQTRINKGQLLSAMQYYTSSLLEQYLD